MVVENQRGYLRDEDGVIDRFPVGMRVLAVDDNPTCLMVLDKLLRQCKYHVTTSTNAIDALRMLRRNRNNFDLVISDVDMPDMDGFKLLELVGLEMDLPVIMLSGHSDTNMVFKGITHGACDYLLKPVRLEELKNIWQHVVRKKKTNSSYQNKASNEDRAVNIPGGKSQNILENSGDQNKRIGKRRKDRDEEGEDDEEGEEEGEGEGTGDEDDPSSQKKPRVVWSVDLHRKFVCAVNQLGLEKAVPKKILDLMNVEGLTRENVASHLQKYRLYLKKAAHQANMVAAFGGGNDSYLRMSGIDGYADFCTSPGSRRISSTTLPSYSSSGLFGRLNSPASFNMRGISPSTLIRPVQSQNTNSSLSKLGNLQSSSMIFPANQSSSLLHSIPTEHNPVDSTVFGVTSGFQDSRTNNCSLQVSNHHILFPGNSRPTHNAGTYRNQPSLGSASLANTNIGICGSSNLLDYNRCTENFESEALLKFPASSLPVCRSFNTDQMPPTSITAFNQISPIGNNPVDFSSEEAINVTLKDARDVLTRCQEGGFTGNIMQPSGYSPRQRWEEHKLDYSENMSRPFIMQESNETALMDGEMGFYDAYPIGSCI